MKALPGIFLALVLSSVGWASKEMEHPKPQSNKDFDQMKTLVGTWEGKSKMDGEKEQTVRVTYELTSGGSTLLEKLFVGTPHEMLSVYHPEGKSVAMTHYCMVGNQPKLKLKKADGKSLSFEMSGTTGIRSAKDTHMHALTITWNGDREITQEWTGFENGKKKDDTKIVLTKK